MPMKKELYPHDWNQTAREVKDAAGWKCEGCGKQCYMPGEKCKDTRKVLTTAHIVPVEFAGSDPSNLVALCSVCHLQFDNMLRRYRVAAKKRIERQSREPLFVAKG